MASHEYNPSDLTSVLRTLSALSNPVSASSSAPISNPTASNVILNQDIHKAGETVDDEDDQYEPSDSIPPIPSSSTATAADIFHSQRKTGQSTSTPTHPTAKPASTSDTGPTDPSTITSWPAALRYVMRTVSQNEALQQRIRRLIQSQHDHEKQWWQGREALLKKQLARVEKKKELDQVLRSVGVPVDTTKEVSTAEENQTELKIYDDKVYKASVQMSEAMTSELRGLGIPFFAIKHALVASRHASKKKTTEEQKDSSGSKGRLDHEDQQLQKQGTLTRDDLLSLQRRMLELLQDLCRE